MGLQFPTFITLPYFYKPNSNHMVVPIVFNPLMCLLELSPNKDQGFVNQQTRES